jgi:hypothetical protein
MGVGFISTSPWARIPTAPRPGRIATASPTAPPSARRPMRFPPTGNPGALRRSTPARWSPRASARWPRRCVARWRFRGRSGSTISSASTVPSGCRRRRAGGLCADAARRDAGRRADGGRARGRGGGGRGPRQRAAGAAARWRPRASSAAGSCCSSGAGERRPSFATRRAIPRAPSPVSPPTICPHGRAGARATRSTRGCDRAISAGPSRRRSMPAQVEVAAFDAMTATAGEGDPAIPDAMHRALGQSRSRWPWFRWKTSWASRRSRTCPERPASIPTGGSVFRSGPRRWPMIRGWSAPPRS